MIHNINEMDDLHESEPPEICYKSVLRVNNELFSMTKELYKFAFPLVYAQHLRTVPRVGKIFVWSELMYARENWQIRGEEENEEVWLAHAENLQYPDYMLLYGALDDSDLVERFWKLRSREAFVGAEYYALVKPLDGTLYCDSVTLVERVI